MYISSLEIWPATWKSYLACRLGYFLTMHSFSTSHICAIFRMENCCHVEFFYIVTMSYYWIDRSAYRGKVLIQTVASILTALNHKIYNWLKSVPPFKHSEANMIDYFLSKSSMQHTACWICNLKKNFGKLILRKCGKDKSRHWSRCYVIISFIVIIPLVAATGVWIAGLIEPYFLSDSIWVELGLFFAFFCFFTSGNLGPSFINFESSGYFSCCKLCNQNNSAHEEL